MKITLFCTFEEQTAGGILTTGRAEALARLGHQVNILFHPFKFKNRLAPKEHIHNQVHHQYHYAKLFHKFSWKTLALFPYYLIWEAPHVLLTLRKSQFIIIHKPLPLSFFYLTLLRLTRFKGKTCVVHSDWEGIGGYADVNYPHKLLKKMLTTFCEESSPYLASIVYCASKVLVQRFSSIPKIKNKCIYLPCGGSPLNSKPVDFTSSQKNVIYMGTYNSLALVNFLLEFTQIVLQKSSNITLTFLGDGKYFDQLKSGVQPYDHRKQINLPGHVNREEVLTHLEKAHFGLVYLNSDYPETFMELSRSSTKIFEYMDSGKIVIGSKFGETKEIIQNSKTGFLVSNSAQKFAQKLLENLDSPKLTAVSKAVQAQFKNNYSHDILMKKLVDFSTSI